MELETPVELLPCRCLRTSDDRNAPVFMIPSAPHLAACMLIANNPSGCPCFSRPPPMQQLPPMLHPLQHACAAGLAESVTMLLHAGAEPNAQDVQGLTALHRSSERGHVAVSHELLAHGANPNLVSRMCVSAFHLASSNCHG